MRSINNYIASEFVKRKAVSKEDSNVALDIATRTKGSYYKELIKKEILDKETVYRTLGDIFGIPFQILSAVSLNYELVDKCSGAYLAEHRLIPYLLKDDVLFVLVDDPLEILSAGSLENQFKTKISLILVTDDVMNGLIQAVINKEKRENALEEGKSTVPDIDEIANDDVVDAPAVALSNTLLEEAVALGASDIHIEPQEDKIRVRYRIDGVLENHCEISKQMYQAVVARYKVISGLDIAERRIPQDGKISLKIKGIPYDFRISTLPIIYGEKIVIRIYDIFGAVHTLKTLANNEKDYEIMNNLIHNPNGIILLTGPTGSGKTTTLYSFLRELNEPGVNIQTVEDPVENQIPGINQLQTNSKTGLTFASALRSILRQDPNIIMVGEIRDEETAHIAVQAAITGHLVLSTIHTNDALTTISRLVDMNIEPYLVSDSLTGAISQRLVRTLCPKCKKEHKLTAKEAKYAELPEGTTIYEPVGCPYCNNSGYKGRTAVFEIMLVGENVKECISHKQYSFQEVYKAAVMDGFVPLKMKLADLLKSGITSLEEYSLLVSQEVEDNESQK